MVSLNSPKISLVTTCFNREKFLSECLESILCQSFQDFELIVWNDGSTDKSLQIALQYASKDSRIQVINSNHQGSSIALSEAIKVSKGEYIGCVDSDDFLLPGCLEKTYKVLTTNPNTGITYTQYYEVDEYSNLLNMPERCNWPYVKELMPIAFLIFHFRLIRKSIYNLVGGIDINYPVAHDYELTLRLIQATNVHQVREPLYCYRKHADSISSKSKALQHHYVQLAVKEYWSRAFSKTVSRPDALS